MRKPIVIVGSGRFAFQIADMVRRIDTYSKVEQLSFCRHASNESETPFQRIKTLPREFNYIIGIGNPAFRELEWKYISNVSNNSVAINLISPGAYVEEGAVLASNAGIIALPNSVVGTRARISRFTIIGAGSIIEHDSKVKSFCTIGPGAVVCGNVDIGRLSLVGANATIIQSLTIGCRSIIGAGSVILDHVDKNSIVVGNPGRVIKKSGDRTNPL